MSSTRRGRPPALSQDDIVDAALELGDAIGFDALSMRTLADALGVATMTLYNYVPSKAALIHVLSDSLLRRVKAPPPETGPWDQRLFTLQRRTRAALGRHPGLPIGTSREATRLAREARAIVAGAGLSPADANLAFGALWTLLYDQLEVSEQVFEFAFEAVLDAVKRRPAQIPASRAARRRRG